MVTSLRKYIRIYWKLVKFSASHEMEYRLSFFLQMFVQVLFFAVTVFGIRVIYWNVPEIAGWNYYELLVLYGINHIFTETILGFVFVYNLRYLPTRIRKGRLDLILSKPINSQFAVSLWRVYFPMLPNIIVGAVTVYVGFRDGGMSFNPVMVAPFAFLFVCGLVMAYSFGMILSTLSMWLVNALRLPRFAEDLLSISRNPSSFFGGAWKIIFMTVLPISFMVSFPTQTLLSDFNLWWLPSAFVLALIFLKGSNIFWNFALKRYSSASS